MRYAVTALLLVLSAFSYARAQLITEIYETCTAVEGEIARCGPNANCFIINGVPTCHCVVDTMSGLALAGNPYKACTWDISGTWQLFSYIDKHTGFYREILNPTTNEPFVIRLDRTDALLKTKYMLGAIFVITALTSFSMGFCGRVFLDVNDNTSIIFEQAEGFLDQNGRSILLRTSMLDTTLMKLTQKITDKIDLKGKWQKSDGSLVEILDLKTPIHWPNKHKTSLTKNWRSYWYNDSSYGAPLLRLSMAIFLDTTLEAEQAAFNSEARFVQVGWYGALRYGSNRINIYSPADGKPIFTFLRIDTFPPLPGIGPSSLPAMTSQQIMQESNATDQSNNTGLFSQMPSSASSIISGIFGAPLGELGAGTAGGGTPASQIAAAGNILSGLTGVGAAAGLGGVAGSLGPALSGIGSIFAQSESNFPIVESHSNRRLNGFEFENFKEKQNYKSSD